MTLASIWAESGITTQINASNQRVVPKEKATEKINSGARLGKLWDKAPAGIGEAVTRGAKGAGEALSKVAGTFATNKDLQKYTAISLGAGALPIAAAVGTTVAPAIVGTAMQHPEKIAAASKVAADFASGAFDQGPPPVSRAGYAGATASKVYDRWKNRR